MWINHKLVHPLLSGRGGGDISRAQTVLASLRNCAVRYPHRPDLASKRAMGQSPFAFPVTTSRTRAKTRLLADSAKEAGAGRGLRVAVRVAERKITLF